MKLPQTSLPALVMISVVAGLAQRSHGQETVSARTKLAEAAMAVRQETARKPYPYQKGEVFDVLSPPNRRAGAGFFLQSGNQTIAVTASHAHPNVVPTKFVRGQRQIPLGARFRDAYDISCFQIMAPVTNAFQFVRREGRILKEGDVVAMIGHGGAHSGKLTGFGLGHDRQLLPGVVKPSGWLSAASPTR